MADLYEEFEQLALLGDARNVVLLARANIEQAQKDVQRILTTTNKLNELLASARYSVFTSKHTITYSLQLTEQSDIRINFSWVIEGNKYALSYVIGRELDISHIADSVVADFLADVMAAYDEHVKNQST